MSNIKHTEERLREVIAKNNTWGGVCRDLGIKPATGAQSAIKKRAVNLDIDFTNFLGQGWMKGKVSNTKIETQDYLVKDSKIKSHDLRLRLIKEGIKEHKCEGCQLTEWKDKKIPLELDHINGDNRDNRLDNLRILCPNCHAQTDTYCSKNIRRCSPTAEATVLEAVQ